MHNQSVHEQTLLGERTVVKLLPVQQQNFLGAWVNEQKPRKNIRSVAIIEYPLDPTLQIK